ncbi:MAG: hypothetical protein ACRDKW_06445 [Actinomycetota bacterium]
MGRLEEALEEAAAGGSTSGGLGAATGSGGVRLQQGNSGSSPEEQIAGEGTLSERSSESGGSGSMPTSPDRTADIEATDQ